MPWQVESTKTCGPIPGGFTLTQIPNYNVFYSFTQPPRLFLLGTHAGEILTAIPSESACLVIAGGLNHASQAVLQVLLFKRIETYFDVFYLLLYFYSTPPPSSTGNWFVTRLYQHVSHDQLTLFPFHNPSVRLHQCWK